MRGEESKFHQGCSSSSSSLFDPPTPSEFCDDPFLARLKPQFTFSCERVLKRNDSTLFRDGDLVADFETVTGTHLLWSQAKLLDELLRISNLGPTELERQFKRAKWEASRQVGGPLRRSEKEEEDEETEKVPWYRPSSRPSSQLLPGLRRLSDFELLHLLGASRYDPIATTFDYPTPPTVPLSAQPASPNPPESDSRACIVRQNRHELSFEVTYDPVLSIRFLDDELLVDGTSSANGDLSHDASEKQTFTSLNRLPERMEDLPLPLLRERPT